MDPVFQIISTLHLGKPTINKATSRCFYIKDCFAALSFLVYLHDDSKIPEVVLSIVVPRLPCYCIFMVGLSSVHIPWNLASSFSRI